MHCVAALPHMLWPVSLYIRSPMRDIMTLPSTTLPIRLTHIGLHDRHMHPTAQALVGTTPSSQRWSIGPRLTSNVAAAPHGKKHSSCSITANKAAATMTHLHTTSSQHVQPRPAVINLDNLRPQNNSLDVRREPASG